MAQDLTSLQETVGELSAAIADRAPEGVVVGDVLIVVELRHPDGRSGYRVGTSKDIRSHGKLGLLHEAETLLSINKIAAMAQRMAAREPQTDTDDDSQPSTP